MAQRFYTIYSENSDSTSFHMLIIGIHCGVVQVSLAQHNLLHVVIKEACVFCPPPALNSIVMLMPLKLCLYINNKMYSK